VTEIQQGRYDRLLRRVADLKGPGSKVNDVLEELFPTLDVENVPSELLFLSGWRLFIGGGQFVSAVGERQHVQLFNPADSGMLIVLEDIYLSSGNATAMSLLPTLTQFVSQPGGGNARDTRAGLPNSVGIIGELSSPAAFSPDAVVRISPGLTLKLAPQNDIAVLAPGTGFNVSEEATAIQLQFVFFWRERVAEASELTF